MSDLYVFAGALVVAAVLAFLIGSIPFGYLIGRFFYRTDIRTQGSGNIGAMNALRTLGKTGAISVLLLDAAKGFVPVFLALRLHGTFAAETLASIAGICTVLGHCLSPWLGWRGGKGVATSFGVIFALSWKAGVAIVGAWIVGALLVTQYSSVGSMLGNVVSPFALWAFTGSVPETIYGVFAAIFIVWTHRENLDRLRAGTENRIGLFRKKA